MSDFDAELAGIRTENLNLLKLIPFISLLFYRIKTRRRTRNARANAAEVGEDILETMSHQL